MPRCYAQREQVWETFSFAAVVGSDGHGSILSMTTHAFSFWGPRCVCLERDKCTNQPACAPLKRVGALLLP